MPALQVRDFPAELYSELKDCAAANHRSIAQQTIACVEEALARRTEAEPASRQVAGQAGEDGGFGIPAEVVAAALRAKSVDAFAWKLGLGEEPEEVRAARRKKRKDLRSRSKKLARAWRGQAPSSMEVAELIRGERDSRGGSVMGGVGGSLSRGER